MSQNINNSQENIELSQQEKEWKEQLSQIFPQKCQDAQNLYYETLIKAAQFLNDVVSTMTDCHEIMKRNNYPTFCNVQRGIKSMKQHLEIHQSQLKESE